MIDAHLVVRNWDRFQHYQKQARKEDYRPAWIKLYTTTLTDPSIASLDPSSRWCLIGLWILAAMTGNKIPENYDWIDRMIGMDARKSVDLIVESGLVERVPVPSRVALEESEDESRGGLYREKREESKSFTSLSAREEAGRNGSLDSHIEAELEAFDHRAGIRSTKATIEQRYLYGTEEMLASKAVKGLPLEKRKVLVLKALQDQRTQGNTHFSPAAMDPFIRKLRRDEEFDDDQDDIDIESHWDRGGGE